MNIYLSKIHWIAIVVLLSFSAACKKQESAAPNLEVENTSKVELDKLIKYIAISFDIDRDRIQYNKTSEEFTVPNTVFKMSLKTIETAYNSANEYKLKYEN